VTWKVEYKDLGLASLDKDAVAKLRKVLDKAAHDVEAAMKANIISRGFVDTRATVNSVAVSAPDADTRDIGPSTEYAIYGELGYVRGKTRVPGLFFARDALEMVRNSFIAACEAALRSLGK